MKKNNARKQNKWTSLKDRAIPQTEINTEEDVVGVLIRFTEDNSFILSIRDRMRKYSLSSMVHSDDAASEINLAISKVCRAFRERIYNPPENNVACLIGYFNTVLDFGCRDFARKMKQSKARTLKGEIKGELKKPHSTSWSKLELFDMTPSNMDSVAKEGSSSLYHEVSEAYNHIKNLDNVLNIKGASDFVISLFMGNSVAASTPLIGSSGGKRVRNRDIIMRALKTDAVLIECVNDVTSGKSHFWDILDKEEVGGRAA